MCTVTFVATFGPAGAPGGIRVACSRDESRGRPAALPPAKKMLGGRKALMPVDAVSGGTWVAVSDAGLVMTLLNRNPRDMRGVTFPGKSSRGGIIPALLHAGSLTEACEAVRRLDASAYPPFRLVIADSTYCVSVTWDEGAPAVHRAPVSGPMMFTSSGLGDALVAAPRRELFDGWFGDDRGDWVRRQDTFHRHRWDDRPELSVNMSRGDAMTVSMTVIELSDQGAALAYHPAPPDVAAGDSVCQLRLAGMTRP
jgi:Transport and Golgi organisation 2